eukprot:m51a1_g3766 hypothetical protein (128) ;mRNA; f:126598-127097
MEQSKIVEGANHFKDLYYRIFDHSRHELHGFYTDPSIIVWNGQRFDRAQFNQFILTQPTTSHTIMALDCQPVQVPDLQPDSTMMITVSGTVSFSGATPRPFTQMFILARENQTRLYYIMNDVYRLLA